MILKLHRAPTFPRADSTSLIYEAKISLSLKSKKVYLFALLYNPLNHQNALYMPLIHKVFENIMENGAFAPLEQMLHFP